MTPSAALCRRVLGVAIAALSAAFLAPAPRAAVAADPPVVETSASRLYVRRPGHGPRAGCDTLAREAASRGVAHALVVFDAISFGTPPGFHEFAHEYRFRADLEEWLESLTVWSATSKVEVWVATTLMERPLLVGSADVAARLFDAADAAWWDDEGFTGFEPAVNWLTRFLRQRRWIDSTEADRANDAGGRAVVLVSGVLAPERWQDGGTWRRRLLPVGEYWDEEAVGTLCRRASAPLMVVAPQTRFGDATPVADVPDFPWVARPVLVMPPMPFAAPAVPPPATPRRGPGLPRPGGGTLPARPGVGPATGPEAGAPPPPAIAPAPAPIAGTYDAAPRFDSATPRFYRFGESQRLFQTDVPSGYGWWPFARAAAKSGGAYFFYPFHDARFLDACPYDPARLGDLGPELVSAAEWEALRGADAALDAVLRAEAEVRDETPWVDSLLGGREAQGWCGFAEASPLRRTSDYRVRRRPMDAPVGGDSSTVATLGARLEGVLPAYERALERLDAAYVAMRSGAMPGRGGRADANLRYARFGFAMSAFHLHALSISMREVERFKPAAADPNHTYGYSVKYVPTIRLSDVLDGYEGLVLPAEKEAEWAPPPRSAADRLLLGQGNLLTTPRADPLYRSRRDLGAVVRNLDPRLFRDAHRMIAAAKDLTADFARTPWGWCVYYADAYTFTFTAALDMRGNVGPAPQGKKQPKPPTTPKVPDAPTPTPAPTTPGGPTTGG